MEEKTTVKPSELKLSPMPVRIRLPGGEWSYIKQRAPDMASHLRKLLEENPEQVPEIEVLKLQDPRKEQAPAVEALDWVPYPHLNGTPLEILQKLEQTAISAEELPIVLKGMLLDLMFASGLSDVTVNFREESAGFSGFYMESPYTDHPLETLEEFSALVTRNAEKLKEFVEQAKKESERDG